MSTNINKSGFTLVEILIVTPLVVLLVAGLIAAMVNITGKSLAIREKGAMIADIQSSLDTMEFDMDKAVDIPYELSAAFVHWPQAVDNSSDAITANSSGGPLIIKSASTTKNPLRDDRALAYENDSSSGGCSEPLTDNPYVPVYYVYFVRNGSLWRRVIKEDGANPCTPTWQRSSCHEDYLGETHCQALDSFLLENVKTFSIDFYRDGATTPVTSWTGSNPPVVADITLETEKEVAGDTVQVSSTIRLTSVNF